MRAPEAGEHASHLGALVVEPPGFDPGLAASRVLLVAGRRTATLFTANNIDGLSMGNRQHPCHRRAFLGVECGRIAPHRDKRVLDDVGGEVAISRDADSEREAGPRAGFVEARKRLFVALSDLDQKVSKPA